MIPALLGRLGGNPFPISIEAFFSSRFERDLLRGLSDLVGLGTQMSIPPERPIQPCSFNIFSFSSAF